MKVIAMAAYAVLLLSQPLLIMLKYSRYPEWPWYWVLMPLWLYLFAAVAGITFVLLSKEKGGDEWQEL